MILHFNSAGVRRLIEHVRSCSEHRTLYKKKVGPGLFLVGDNGIYLSSNGIPEILEDGTLWNRTDPWPSGTSRLVVYAEECNPKTMPFDAWWDEKQRSFGGDDGFEFLSLETVKSMIGPKWFVLDVTKDEIRFLEASDATHP